MRKPLRFWRKLPNHLTRTNVLFGLTLERSLLMYAIQFNIALKANLLKNDFELKIGDLKNASNAFVKAQIFMKADSINDKCRNLLNL
jgi:hypothetical protein